MLIYFLSRGWCAWFKAWWPWGSHSYPEEYCRNFRLWDIKVTRASRRGRNDCWIFAKKETGYCRFHGSQVGFVCLHIIWAPSSEFVSSSIPSWQILTAYASHSEELGIWLSVWRFLLTHCLYERVAEVLARLHGCAGSPEPSLLTYAIRTKFPWRGPYLFCFVVFLLVMENKIKLSPTLFFLFEPCHEKTCFRVFWPGKTQTDLLS